MRILVIDDDGLAGAMSAAILEDLGHQAILTESAAQAQAWLVQDPDIGMIISDYHMPVTSGLELFHQLRSSGFIQPFILLSGDQPAALLRQAPELDACVLKDAELESSLAQAIAQILSRTTLE